MIANIAKSLAELEHSNKQIGNASFLTLLDIFKNNKSYLSNTSSSAALSETSTGRYLTYPSSHEAQRGGIWEGYINTSRGRGGHPLEKKMLQADGAHI